MTLTELIRSTSALPGEQAARPGGEDSDLPRAPATEGDSKLMPVLAAACEDAEGITPVQFRALLSPEDIDDILAGDIPAAPTLHAYALGFAEGIRSGRVQEVALVVEC